MGKKTTFALESTEKALQAILARIEVIEKALAVRTPPPFSAESVEQAVLLEKLERLTIKRHAVLTATLGGLSYRDISTRMACDDTTVKLQLKAVLDMLDIPDRAMLLVSWTDLLHFIPDQEYERRFGLSKRWWLTQKPGLMAVLRATKPANNQYTK